MLLEGEDYLKLQPGQFLNVNLGVLGHVDSGKTSLCQCLTQVQSTACHDKSPQSKERGITLDLGFSAVYAHRPAGWGDDRPFVQVTLVDCPGHASLIRTVVGGAQIIDAVLLVLDVTKGMQTQTGECLAIAELLVPRLVVLLNKVDLLPPEERDKVLARKVDMLRKNIFSKTRFGVDVPFVPFSTLDKERVPGYSEALLQAVLGSMEAPRRRAVGPMVMLADHCFLLKGKGCVFTGTVVQGRLRVNDEFELPEFGQKRKVKSLQVFHKGVEQVIQGDRVALMTQMVEGDKPERTTLCSPGLLQRVGSVIIDLNKISYFKLPIKTKANFHVISGHQTTMAQVRLFSAELSEDQQKMLLAGRGRRQGFNDWEEAKEGAEFRLDKGQEYEVLTDLEEARPGATVFARLTFERPVLCSLGSFLIASKLDIDEAAKVCRMAFHGQVLLVEQEKEELRLFRWKERRGQVERLADEQTLIVRDMFNKEVDLNKLIKQPVLLDNGQTGIMMGPFGKSGKLKVRLDEPFRGEGEGVVVYRYKKYYR